MARQILLPLIVFATALVAGQEPPPRPVFTTAQAAAGKAAFGKACAHCHMADLSGANEVPPLAGTLFMTTWGARTTKELFDYVAGAMPPGGPAQTQETYEAILSYVLQANGAVAGTEPLTESTELPISEVTLPAVP